MALKITLDTTVFREDRSMQGSAWRTFAGASHFIPSFELFVPELVVDEAVNSFREDLEAAWVGLDRAAQKVDRLLGRAPSEAAGRDLEQATREYRDRVIQRIRDLGGRFLGYPKVEHRDLVRRDLGRRKPFDRNGRGYRDALIWESIRELLAKGVDRVIFVSGNERDFGTGSLHEQLSSDVEFPGLVRVVKSLAVLNEELILPRMAMIELTREALRFSGAPGFDPAAWLKSSPLELLRDHVVDLAPLVAGFPAGVGVALPAAVLEADELRGLEMRELSDREVHLRVRCRLLVRMLLQWTGEEARNHPEVQTFSEGPIDYAAARRDIPAELRMGVDLVVNREKSRVESEAVGFIRGDHGTCDYAGWADDHRRRPEPAANASPLT